MSLLERDKAAIWHPFTPLIGSQDPLPLKAAEGIYLITEDDRRIMDAISSWWVNLHGHSNPVIAEAVAEQAKKLEHVIFAGFSHEPAITLAENLLSILPDNQSKIFYSDDGSTAVEVAIKMAIQYWHNKHQKRRRLIAIDGAYHGDTFGSMSVGDRGPFTAPFDQYLFDVAFLPFPEGKNDEEVFALFKKQIDSGEIAAFIFEPIIQGAVGMKIYSAELLDRMIALAQAEGVICIADEVMTGFGRTGTMFASDRLTHKPDIFCLSKGLTGGAMAMGVTSCTEAVIDAYRSSDIMKTFFHGHSFTANPIACAAANASFRLLNSDTTRAQMRMINDEHLKFATIAQQYKYAANVRVMGTIFALDIANFGETSYVNEARHKLYPYFLARDILLRPLGNVLYILPPYIIKRDELAYIYGVIEAFLQELET